MLFGKQDFSMFHIFYKFHIWECTPCSKVAFDESTCTVRANYCMWANLPAVNYTGQNSKELILFFFIWPCNSFAIYMLYIRKGLYINCCNHTMLYIFKLIELPPMLGPHISNIKSYLNKHTQSDTNFITLCISHLSSTWAY